MKLIVGLGNPGKKYNNTRHNLGFLYLDKLQMRWNFPVFTLNKKLETEISSGQFNGEKIILAKPQTFMNLSGSAVQKILAFHKLIPDDLLVIHDDKDIVLGKYKLATNSSSAGHNGVQNIIDLLGTKKINRLRIGIKNTDEQASSQTKIIDFVLGKLTQKDFEEIKKIEKEILEEVEK